MRLSTAPGLDEATVQRLEQLAQSGTPRPWYVAGPPWTRELPSWVQAGSEDPHAATPILQPPDDIVYGEGEAPAAQELADNLDLTCAAVNALPGLLAERRRLLHELAEAGERDTDIQRLRDQLRQVTAERDAAHFHIATIRALHG